VKEFISNNIPKSKKNILGVAEEKLGSAIQEATQIKCALFRSHSTVALIDSAGFVGVKRHRTSLNTFVESAFTSQHI